MGSTTTGQTRKPLIEVAGAPVLIHTLRKLDCSPNLSSLWVALRPEDRESVEHHVAAEKLRLPVHLVAGGENRQASVLNALREIAAQERNPQALVAVHDAVRPFVELATIERVVQAAAAHGAAIVALPAVDTVKQVQRVGGDANCVVATLQRERIVLAQTPQVFRLGLLLDAYEKAVADGFYATDESSLLEHFGHEVFVVPGSVRNWKITNPSDLKLAEIFLSLPA